MISHEDVAAAEYLIRETKALVALTEGLRRSPRGRKPNDRALELLLIGLFLSIQDRGVATVLGAHRTLTEELPLDEQLRLGVRFQVDGKMETISYRELTTQADRLSDLLAYGELSTPDLDDEERRRRQAVVTGFSNTLMDAFDFGWEVDTYALDATGIWSWGRGGKRRKPITDEEKEGEDEKAIKEVEEFVLHGEGPDGRPAKEPSETPTPSTRKRRRRRDRTKDRWRKWQDVADAPAVDEDDGLGYTTSVDPDANWGFKTAKSGEREGFFGYHEHTLVLAPEERIEDNPKTLPALVRRLELTPASKDIVDVSLRMLDSLPGIRHVIVDNHYHYKSTDRWLDQLIRRGIHQHHDLRKDEQGFVEYDRLKWAAGHPHGPCAPDELGVIPSLPPTASKEEVDAFNEDVEKRRRYALRIVNQPGVDGVVRCQCSALAGEIGCPLREGTIEAAIALGRPVVEDPPNAERDGEPLPRICTQVTATYRPPEKIRKLQQLYYWGSKQWRRIYKRRTYVEGTYGNRKNVSTENMRRGLFQRMGLPWTNIVVSLVAAAYNLRMVQGWHDRSRDGDPNHPLLRRGEKGRPWMYLTEEAASEIDALFAGTLGRSGEGPDVSTLMVTRWDRCDEK